MGIKAVGLFPLAIFFSPGLNCYLVRGAVQLLAVFFASAKHDGIGVLYQKTLENII